ncbi:MAG: hypothetical protein KGH65_04895 [Candidatus Micrarchaeota archaeon]|nr:hypothetical protein [Candidatus Micrarchaeota archaeon]
MQAIKTEKEPVIVFIRRDAADKLRELAKIGDLSLRQINSSERKLTDWKDSEVRHKELEKAKGALLKNSKEGIAPSRAKFIQIVGESFVWALTKGYFPELGSKYMSFAEFYGLRVKRKSIDKKITIKWSNPKVRGEYLAELKGWMTSNSTNGIAPSIQEFKKNHDSKILNALRLGSFPEIGKNYGDLVKFLGFKTKGKSKSEAGDWKNKTFKDKELEEVKNWMISNSKNGTSPSQKEFAKQHLRFIGALQLGIFPEIGTKYTDLVRFVGLKQLKKKWMDKETKEKILEEAREWIVKNSVGGIPPNKKEFITEFGCSLLDALRNNHFPLIGREYNDILKHYGLGLPDERNIRGVISNKSGQWKNINFRNKQLEITKSWLNKNSVNGIAPISKEFTDANGPISNALSAGYFPEIGTNYGDLVRFLGLRLKSSTLYIDWKDPNEKNKVLLDAKEWLIDNSKNGIAPSMKIFLKERGNALINALWVGHYPDIGNNYSSLVSYVGLKTIRQPRVAKNNRINWKDATEKIANLRKTQKWVIDNSTDGIAPSVRSFVKEKNAFYQALRNNKFPEIGATYDSFIKSLGLQNKEIKRISLVKELARSF